MRRMNALQKVSNAGKTLWNHKKKALLAVIASGFLVNYLQKWKRNCHIRSVYARKALKFGEENIKIHEKIQSINVLVNSRAGSGRAFEAFKTNALPLLNLAGFKVDIIQAKDKEQLCDVAKAIDSNDCDILYVVGGDGTISDVLTAFNFSEKFPEIPIAIFPGGKENRSLLNLCYSIFSARDNVKWYCESAMAVINKSCKPVSIANFTIENSNSEKSNYGLSNLSCGWFQYIEQKKEKLWYWGGLKRRFAYFWELLKRNPSNLNISLIYEEYCEGCSKCRLKPKFNWSFGSISKKLLGLSRNDKEEIYFSNIINENCGVMLEMSLEGKDICIEPMQDKDRIKFRLRIGGKELTRFGAMLDGWKRCSANDLLTVSTEDSFYDVDVIAKRVTLKYQELPKFLKTFQVFGEDHQIEFDTKYHFADSNKKIYAFLPNEASE